MKKIISTLIAIAMIMSSMGLVGFAANGADEWDGTADTSWFNPADIQDSYELDSAEALAGLAKLLAEHDGTGKGDLFPITTEFKLVCDVDLMDIPWIPIGTGVMPDWSKNSDRNCFNSSFDGGNHTIYNLNVTGYPYAGLFGNTKSESYGGSIKNITISDAYIRSGNVLEKSSKTGTGALIGRANKYIIENCHLTGDIDISGERYVGGLIGHSYVQIFDSSVKASGTINATTYQAGGLIGVHFANNGNSSVEDCDIVGDDANGGLTVKSGAAAVGGAIGAVSEVVSNTVVDNIKVENVSVVAGSDAYGDKAYVAGGYVATNSSADNVTVKYTSGDSAAATDSANLIVAEINGQTFNTLKVAIKAAALIDGAVIELRPGTISEGDIKLPTPMNNVTIRGNGTTILNTTITAADGNSVHYDGFRVEGIRFENSHFVLGGQRSGGVLYRNLVFDNNEFVNIVRTNSLSVVHMNVGSAANTTFENFTFTNNTIDGVSGGNNSGIYVNGGIDGNITIENNTFKNIAYAALNVPVRGGNGNADVFSVRNNVFADNGSSALITYSVGGNTDDIQLNVNENIINVTGGQAIQAGYYGNFDLENNEINLSHNYYGFDIDSSSGRFYINAHGINNNPAELIKYGIYPVYTELTATGEIDTDSLFEGVADDIFVTLEKADINGTNDTLEGEDVYDIVLNAESGIINRLNSGDLTFKLETTRGDVVYEIIPLKDSNIKVAPVEGEKNRYEFHFGTKTNVAGEETGATLKIAQIRFTGYGEYKFIIVKDADTNAVHTTTLVDNIVDTYLVDGMKESDGSNPEGTLGLDAEINAEIKVPTRDLTINLYFNNSVKRNAPEYQQMTVTVSGGDLVNEIVIPVMKGGIDTKHYAINEPGKDGAEYYYNHLTSETENNVMIVNALTVNTTYNVKVEGEGYRTAYYSVTMNEDVQTKTLNFWNNVKDNAEYVEAGKETSKKNVTFLAGDIVKDNIINIYDLSAVVSYFGETELSAAKNPGYAKYDLNRDGKIDSKDVAYVLVSWNK